MPAGWRQQSRQAVAGGPAGQCPASGGQVLLQSAVLPDQWGQWLQIVIDHEGQGPHNSVLVDHRKPRHHQLLVMEFHDIQKPRLPGADGFWHAGVGDHVADWLAHQLLR